MEVWNPLDGTVKTVSEDFPAASTINHGSKLVSINNGAQLIFYEGATDKTDSKGIWKFDSATSSWSQIGELLLARDDFAVLPLKDVSCPRTN